MIFWMILHTICCISFGFAIRGLFSVSPSKTVDDYVDWSKIPETAIEIGVDCDGWAWMFKEPIRMICGEGNNGEWISESGCGMIGKVPTDAIIGPLPPWRESLRRRPARV